MKQQTVKKTRTVGTVEPAINTSEQIAVRNTYRVMICTYNVGYIEVEAFDEEEAGELAREDWENCGDFTDVNSWAELCWSGGDGPGVRLVA